MPRRSPTSYWSWAAVQPSVLGWLTALGSSTIRTSPGTPSPARWLVRLRRDRSGNDPMELGLQDLRAAHLGWASVCQAVPGWEAFGSRMWTDAIPDHARRQYRSVDRSRFRAHSLGPFRGACLRKRSGGALRCGHL